MAVTTVNKIIEEREVDFMTDPEIQFVSLVKRGANRTPFIILKDAKDEGGLKMNKVVQSVIIPKHLDRKTAEQFLKDYNTAEVVESPSYLSYVQVPADSVKAEDSQVIILNKDPQILAVVAPLKDADAKVEIKSVSEDGEKVGAIKVDWATLDAMYTELYAMADIVSGVMRQEKFDPDLRKTVIMTAIDNFRVYADALLENPAASKSYVKVENHPDKVTSFFIKQEEKPAEPAPAQEEVKTDEPAKEDPPKEDAAPAQEEVKEEAHAVTAEELAPAVASAIMPQVTDAIRSVIDGLRTDFDKKFDDLAASYKEDRDFVESLRSRVRKSAGVREDTGGASATEATEDGQKKKGVFSGTFLRQ